MKHQTTKKLSAFIMIMMFSIVCAHAQIIYTDIIPDSTSTGSYNLDLNNDGISDFLIAHTASGGPCAHRNDYIKISPQNGSKCSAKKRTAGDVISSSLSYSAVGNQIMTALHWTRGESSCIYHLDGTWYNAVTGYLALQLVVSGNTYYGWARLNTSGASSFTIQDYGYNSIPDQPILAGETSCSTATVNLTQSDSLSFCAGDSVTLTANGTGYQYQWKKNNINITGAILKTYVAKTAGDYKCKVTNSCGSKTSGTRTVTVSCRLSNEVFTEQLENPFEIKIAPNPLSNFTTISFSLQQSEKVLVKIFDVNGHLIKILADAQMHSGIHQLTWNAKDEKENAVGTGIYLLKMRAGNYVETKKISIIK